MKIGVYSFEDGKEPKDLKKQIKVLKKQHDFYAMKYLLINYEKTMLSIF